MTTSTELQTGYPHVNCLSSWKPRWRKSDKKGSFYLDEGRTLNPNTTDLRGASILSPAFAAFFHYQGPVVTVLRPKITLKGF